MFFDKWKNKYDNWKIEKSTIEEEIREKSYDKNSGIISNPYYQKFQPQILSHNNNLNNNSGTYNVLTTEDYTHGNSDWCHSTEWGKVPNLWNNANELNITIMVTEDKNYLIEINKNFYICEFNEDSLKRRLTTLIEKHMLLNDINGDKDEEE